MRWLAMVMNFNDVYQPVRRRKTHKSAASGSVSAVATTVKKERDAKDGLQRERSRKGKERAAG